MKMRPKIKIPLTMASLTRDQKDAIYSLAKDIADGMVVRIHWIMLLAMADEFGIGRIRMDRFITRYQQYIDEYEIEKKIDAADDLLTLRIRRRGWADIYKF